MEVTHQPTDPFRLKPKRHEAKPIGPDFGAKDNDDNDNDNNAALSIEHGTTVVSIISTVIITVLVVVGTTIVAAIVDCFAQCSVRFGRLCRGRSSIHRQEQVRPETVNDTFANVASIRKDNQQ